MSHTRACTYKCVSHAHHPGKEHLAAQGRNRARNISREIPKQKLDGKQDTTSYKPQEIDLVVDIWPCQGSHLAWSRRAKGTLQKNVLQLISKRLTLECILKWQVARASLHTSNANRNGSFQKLVFRSWNMVSISLSPHFNEKRSRDRACNFLDVVSSWMSVCPYCVPLPLEAISWVKDLHCCWQIISVHVWK